MPDKSVYDNVRTGINDKKMVLAFIFRRLYSQNLLQEPEYNDKFSSAVQSEFILDM